MQNKTFQALTKAAEHLMERSTDPIHDTGHASRVVTYLKHMQGECGLTKSERQAIIIAGWWHDVSSYYHQKSSLVWMPLEDDSLRWHAFVASTEEWYLRVGCLFGDSSHLGQSLGTGAFLKKFSFPNETNFLPTFKDADTLDTFLHRARRQNA